MGRSAPSDRGRETLVLQELAPTRTAPPILRRRRDCRLPLVVRRQPRGVPRLLSAEIGVHGAPESGRPPRRAAAADRSVVGSWESPGLELPARAQSGIVARA